MVYQRDLVENLPHSNKSILTYLKKLSEFGLAETGTTIYRGKRVVYHQLTKHGWGLARFFFEGLPSDIDELTAFLLEDYLSHMIVLFRERGLQDSTVFDVFTRARARVAITGSPKYESPDFLLFGASAYHTRISCEELPSAGGMGSCKFSERFPGGSTYDLATELAKHKHKVKLVSSVGADLDGQSLITYLIQHNVDVSDIVIDNERHTNQTIILDEKKGSRTLVDTDEHATLSIRSPAQVPWESLEQVKVVYIGEVFVEAAASIAANARTHDKPVVYLVSTPFLEFGFDKIQPILDQINILLITTHAWQHLRKSSRSNPLSEIRSYTDADIVARDSKGDYKVYAKTAKPLFTFPATGSTEMTASMVAGILIGISENLSIDSAIKLGHDMELDLVNTG